MLKIKKELSRPNIMLLPPIESKSRPKLLQKKPSHSKSRPLLSKEETFLSAAKNKQHLANHSSLAAFPSASPSPNS